MWLLFFVYTVSVAQNSDKVYKMVYDMPEFSGGVDSLSKFLRDSVKYPYQDRLNKNEGVVLDNDNNFFARAKQAHDEIDALLS